MRAWALAMIAFALASCATPAPERAEAPWRSLITERGLDAWVVRGGAAAFKVEGGEIVGVSALRTPNTFLTTSETFGDFILEYELKVDPRLNAGVQIRSRSEPGYRDGVVHGYQVEADPSPRAWSGGIYDEQRRGWLYPLDDNPKAQAAFRNGAWNHFRVEAIGPSIRTWVNGVPAANLVDAVTPSGFIGLQVHSIPDDPALAGLETRYRNIRILTEDLGAHRTAADPSWKQKRAAADAG